MYRDEAGEQVRITRHGGVVAVLVPPDLLRSRRAATAWAAADQIGQRLEETRKRPLTSGISVRHADELVQEIRADRQAR